MKYDCIVTLSGGIDSTVLTHHLVKNGKQPLCVYIDYNTKSKEGELRASRKTCELLGLDFKIIPFHLYSDLCKAFILGNTDEYEQDSQFWLEGRNGLIGFILAILASSNGIKEVYMGINYDDYDENYIDTNSDFILALNNLISHSIKKDVKVLDRVCYRLYSLCIISFNIFI